MSDKTLWGIHAGRTGEADALFLKQKLVALGWSEVKDLAQLPPDREAFKTKIAECYPNAKPGAIPNYAGQLFRFVHEMKQGDFIAYPSKQDRKIHLGRITGEYKYDPKQNSGYPNIRSVEWLRDVSRTQFSQGALYEIGSAMSLFQIKNYAEEFYAVIEGKSITPSVELDETVSLVAEEIEETTQDFILKTLAQQLKGHAFAHFVAHLLQRMGYHTRISPKGPEGALILLPTKMS